MSGAAAKPVPATTTIAGLIDRIPGWTPPDQLLALHMLATTTARLGGDVLEIGSWCGRSTAVLGHAVAASGTGHVWAVDLFPAKTDWRTNPDGTHSFEVEIGGRRFGSYEDQTVWDEPFQRDIVPIYETYDGILDAFTAAIDGAGLSDTVTAFRGDGAGFAAQAPAGLKIRLAFLDGDHSYQAVCDDIDAAERFLLPGGWIAFDDAFSTYDGVDAAIRDRIIGSDRYSNAHQVSRKLFVAQRRA